MMSELHKVVLASLLAASAASLGCKEQRVENLGDEQRGPRVREMVEDWPRASRDAARTMMDRYGQPDEATRTRLIWHRNGPWKRTVVYREPIDHNFPMPHKAVLEQFIDYYVPVSLCDEMAAFDGSITLYRAAGEMSSLSHMEEANFLALNLAHDIVYGDRSVEEARNFFGKEMLSVINDQPAPYAVSFVFPVPRGGTADPGEGVAPLTRRPDATSSRVE